MNDSMREQLAQLIRDFWNEEINTGPASATDEYQLAERILNTFPAPRMFVDPSKTAAYQPIAQIQMAARAQNFFVCYDCGSMDPLRHTALCEVGK